MNLLMDSIESRIGIILIVSDGENLCALDFEDCEDRMRALLRRRYGNFSLCRANDPQGLSSRIRAYFEGDHGVLDKILVSTGGTAFQRQVWNALRAIPAGSTISYGTLAERIGKPNAGRAVGLANSLNPVAIVVPCHRVIGARATLTGYAGGLQRKRWLLAHEGVDLRKRQQHRLRSERVGL
ncbi:MAG: cysteine methyltransferase [Acidobacteria bacterium]|nr:MAG: cysteine methyltransferase [Acidobacteriota bacterium]